MDEQFVNLMSFDFLNVVVFREEVEKGETARVLEALGKMLTPDAAVKFFNRVDITFHGYDDDTRELWEIPEVRKFVYELDEGFPYWLYFLNKASNGLMSILLCFTPPFISHESQIFRERLGDYLQKRGVPAMNHIAELTGCSEQEIERMSSRVFKYVENGPEKPD